MTPARSLSLVARLLVDETIHRLEILIPGSLFKIWHSVSAEPGLRLKVIEVLDELTAAKLQSPHFWESSGDREKFSQLDAKEIWRLGVLEHFFAGQRPGDKAWNNPSGELIDHVAGLRLISLGRYHFVLHPERTECIRGVHRLCFDQLVTMLAEPAEMARAEEQLLSLGAEKSLANRHWYVRAKRLVSDCMLPRNPISAFRTAQELIEEEQDRLASIENLRRRLRPGLAVIYMGPFGSEKRFEVRRVCDNGLQGVVELVDDSGSLRVEQNVEYLEVEVEDRRDRRPAQLRQASVEELEEKRPPLPSPCESQQESWTRRELTEMSFRGRKEIASLAERMGLETRGIPTRRIIEDVLAIQIFIERRSAA